MKGPLPRRLVIALACVVLILVVAWAVFGTSKNPPAEIKALAMKAAVGDPQSISRLKALGPKAVPGLIQVLEYQDSYWRRKTWVVWPRLPRGLGRMLLAKVGPLEAPDVRVAGAKSLGLLGPQAEPAVRDLLRRLHDPEPYVAIAAAGALAQIGTASIPGLSSALADTNASVRHAAAYGLGEIGPAAEPAVPELIETLQDADPAVRSSTAYSLTLIGFPSLLALSNLIDHADAPTRQDALKELIRLYRSLRWITPTLNKMAHAQDLESRRLAIEALGSLRTGDEATLNTFIESLKDPAAEIRVAAARCLNQVAWRSTNAVGALRNSLRDSSPAVRAWVAKDLGAVGPSARVALEDLTRALHDTNADVQQAAGQAIQTIESYEATKN